MHFEMSHFGMFILPYIRSEKYLSHFKSSTGAASRTVHTPSLSKPSLSEELYHIRLLTYNLREEMRNPVEHHVSAVVAKDREL